MNVPVLTRRAALLGGVSFVAACAAPRFLTYSGPEVTSIVVYKRRRKMHLLHNSDVLKTYDFELGFAPVGHKQIEGDGRTPEGLYYIDRKNPNSSYHLSVGISYPNNQDRARAAALGHSPGGDIFIHGTPRAFRGERDWTWGCIAVSNPEIEVIYSMVNVGTPIWLYA
jgi:murein L,D-transpeptidase YafK